MNILYFFNVLIYFLLDEIGNNVRFYIYIFIFVDVYDCFYIGLFFIVICIFNFYIVIVVIISICIKVGVFVINLKYYNFFELE